VLDLGLQRLCGLLHGGDRSKHLCKMLLQYLAALEGGCVPFTAQMRENLHLPDGHVGLAQAQQESDPFHVRSRIAALATRCTRHRRYQPGALVVAQRVCSQASA
jgi:hypothetical protein